MIIRLNMTNIYYCISGIFVFCQVRTENEWWRNQGILGVGNRHDNNNNKKVKQAKQLKKSIVPAFVTLCLLLRLFLLLQ